MLGCSTRAEDSLQKSGSLLDCRAVIPTPEPYFLDASEKQPICVGDNSRRSCASAGVTCWSHPTRSTLSKNLNLFPRSLPLSRSPHIPNCFSGSLFLQFWKSFRRRKLCYRSVIYIATNGLGLLWHLLRLIFHLCYHLPGT